MRLGVPVASPITAFAVCCCRAEGSLQPLAGALAALSLAEREDISRGIASGSSIRTIASGLGRAASTVSREVTRHGDRAAYRAHDADNQAWGSGLRPKKCLLAGNRKLRNMVGTICKGYSLVPKTTWCRLPSANRRHACLARIEFAPSHRPGGIGRNPGQSPCSELAQSDRG